MASLPSNTFMFNYNAREYNSSTHTFSKTEGQLFDEDLVLNQNPNSVGENYVYFGNTGAYMGKTFGGYFANPFNRDSSNSSFTIIYKTSGFTSGSENLVANRGNLGYNYMVRGNKFHTSDANFLNLTPSTSPEICLIRIYSDGRSERKFLDSNGTVLQSTSSGAISWGTESNAIGFFSGYGNQGAEYFTKYFYWMYCSLETLTDAEVLQVIQYNENTGPTFEVDTTVITATYSATTSSVTLTAEDDMAWTASTSNDWITLSATGGTGSSVFTVSVATNKAYAARNGLVTVTNGEDVIEITVEQAKHPLLIPNENIYRADLEVVKGYRSGSTINKAYRSGELIYYKLNYPQGPDYKSMPLTFNIISAGTINWKAYRSSYTKDIQYSVNDGPWSSITSSTDGTPISLNTGDVVRFKGDGAISTGAGAYNYFAGATAIFEAYGNVASLIDSTNYATITTVADHSFRNLFVGASGLTSAENLILPATTLASNCYSRMFFNCTGLTSAPELPATTLASSCYQGMFTGCRSLTTAPKLPATTLQYQCYNGMFQGCASLNYIKCLATDISEYRCTYSWVNGVGSTGTFVTPSSTEWTTGTSGIPSGWTRVDA